MNEETKSEIVKKILEELKNKKLLNNTRSAYRSTEKVLYSLNVLPKAIELINDEIKQLENDLKGIPRTQVKSNTLVLNERNNTYVYGDETLETRISELKQIVLKTKSRIRLVNNALKKIEKDKWYSIIPLYYFDRMKIESVAEKLECAVSTVGENKKRLINELKVYIFPDIFIEEL